MSSDRVLVVIGRTRHKMVVAELQEAVKRGAEFIELRLDFLAKAIDFKRLLPYKQCPWVATLRRPADGGRFSGTEAGTASHPPPGDRSGAFDWVDLETDIASQHSAVRPGQANHQLPQPERDARELWIEIYAEMLKQDADVYKIAVTAQNPEDMVRVLQLQKAAPKPTVAFCMGDIGQPSRFLALKYGAPWIYAAFNKERGIAPGLPSLDDFKTTYPVRAIAANTRVFGVVGDPVDHSLSPLLHNHIYKQLGVNALYLPFRVPRGCSPRRSRPMTTFPVSGYSVTIPHKEAAAQLAREKELNVEITQAANTLVRMTDGKFSAANTDYAAAIDSLKAHLAERAKDGPVAQLSQLSVLLLGAGGAARAVAFGLHREGAQLTITGRTYERAQRLAEEVKCKAVDWHARHSVSFDVLD